MYSRVSPILHGVCITLSNKKKKVTTAETTSIIFVFFGITVYVCGYYFQQLKKSTVIQKGQMYTSLKHFEEILKGKGDILGALLQEKVFEKTHDAKRYFQLFKKQK